MAVNFRGRVGGCGEKDVGNYVDILSHTPSDYATPDLIRKSVTPPVYAGASVPPSPMPTKWKHAPSATYTAITNWATFARPIALPAGSKGGKGKGEVAAKEDKRAALSLERVDAADRVWGHVHLSAGCRARGCDDGWQSTAR